MGATYIIVYYIFYYNVALGQERRHEFESGGWGQYIEQRLVYTVKTLKFEKSGGCMTPPPPPIWWCRPCPGTL